MNNKQQKAAEKTPETALKPQAAGTLANMAAPQRGLEDGDDAKDLIISRASLLQSTSDEIKQGLEGFKVGMIVDSLTKEALPPIFIPVFRFKQYLRWNPRQTNHPYFDKNYDPGALIWRSDNPDDPRVIKGIQFGPNNEAPEVTEYMNFFSWFPGIAMPIIVSFSKTSYDAGKQLYSFIKRAGGDIFSRKYSLTSKDDSNKAGDTYKVFVVRPAGTASPEEHAYCEMLWTKYAHRVKEINVEEEHPKSDSGKPWENQ